VISPATHRLIEGYFACQALGVPVRPRVSPPGPAYRVLQSIAASRLDAGVTTGLTPLVGREREVGLLLERWEQANEGRGQVVLLSGEPGIGKSRLVQVLDLRLAGEPPTRLEYRCSAYHQNSALYPVIETLQRLLQFTRDHSAQQKLSTLEAMLEAYGFSLEEAMPLFAPLLALPLPDRYSPLAGTPERRKQKTLEALLAWLLKEAERHVTLSVWEDLQWIDPSTLELLGLFLEEAPTASVLVLLTCRPEFSPPWTTRSHLTQIPLGRLPRKQVEVMIERVAGGRPLPGEVLQQLVTKTDGVPLFVEELTKMVLESGLLEERDGRYELTGPLAPLAIPSTLHDSLMARLDRLGPGKELAQLGAAIGREFPYELIREVSSRDEGTLQQELTRLVDAELLSRSGVPPQARYVFRHALIQDAAYQSLLESTQRQYHRQIARALEDRFPEVGRAHPELLAHHYTEAGLESEAVVYWQRAGQGAIERSANVEAVGHLSQGLVLLETLPDTPERAQHELTLQLTLGASLVMIKGYKAAEVENVYTRARQLHPQVGDSPQRFSALFGLWRFHSNRGELQTAHELGGECFALAQRLHDPALLLQAHFALGVASFHLGEFASALRDLERGIALYDPGEHAYLAFLHGADPNVACRCYMARVLWFLGYPDQALAQSQEAMTLARQSSHTSTLGFALHLASTFHTYRREVDVVRDLADATIALANDHGFVRWLGSGLMRRGWALAEQGSPERGIEQLRQGLTTWQALGALGLSHFLALLAEAHAKGGQFDAGLRVVDEALAVTHSNAERHYEAELYRLKGELLLQQDVTRAAPASPGSRRADACFHRALDLAGRTQAKSLELRAAMSLSRLWQRQGRRLEAHRLLAETYGWFTEGFDTPDLQEAKALLETLA
jgi:tetratricopeptide (TPR) repeat protein